MHGHCSHTLLSYTDVVIEQIFYCMKNYRLGYVCNPCSLTEGTETLCRDDIREFTWEPQSSLTLR